MEVVRLNQNLFNKLRGKEISTNKNGSRPYYYSFKRNNNRVCIPFRTNAQQVPNKYKVNLGGEQPDKPNSAIDLTKSIVISNDEYLNNRSKAKIPQNVNNFLKQQAPTIEQKYDTMSKDYIKAKASLSQIPLVKYSTMQYFHKELNIQDSIDNQQTKNAINELITNGRSNRYNKLQSSLPNEKLDLLDDYETLYDFKSLTHYPTKIIFNDIDNPYLEVEKNNKHFTLSALTIKNKPEKYVNDFLNDDRENQKNNDVELDL
ncbi:hypothetical protein PYH72_05185 [Staphylococcus delphini]|uniref:hypothetical protein n=2 Tax=Staphylococcus delphini TaxID=53344 RepID=UPI000BBC63B6|nr:hypothetical protein [Staphylococcus delphini]PCF48538.1 hypothetical protein B5C09_05885 [Staphylococcus delphini]